MSFHRLFDGSDAQALPRPKKAKTKRPSLSSITAKADKLTSLHIRQKFADSSGYVKCVSCPTVLHWTQAHCAHYIGRASKATRWLEENLHPACPSCNVFRKEHHMREYTIYMIDTYGREFVDELRAMEKQVLSAGQVRALAETAITEFSPSERM